MSFLPSAVDERDKYMISQICRFMRYTCLRTGGAIERWVQIKMDAHLTQKRLAENKYFPMQFSMKFIIFINFCNEFSWRVISRIDSSQYRSSIVLFIHIAAPNECAVISTMFHWSTNIPLRRLRLPHRKAVVGEIDATRATLRLNWMDGN